MKQKKQLTVMLLILAASIALYAAVCAMMAEKSRPEANAAAAEEKLFDFGMEDITSLSWENESGTHVLEKDSDGHWALRENPSVSLNMSRVEQMLDEVAALKSGRTLEEGDPAEYGLSDPSVVRAATASGEVEISLGDKASIEDQYYVRKSGDDRIFLCDTSLPQMLQSDITDLVQFEAAVHMLAPNSLIIERKDGSGFEAFRPEDPEQYSYTNYYSWFTENEDGSFRPLDRNRANALVTEAAEPQWQSCADLNASDLSRYGLDAPEVKVSVADGSSETTVIIGAQADENSRYAAYEGSSMVYTVKNDLYEDLNAASAESLRAEDICHMDWETVTEMDISYDGKTRSISIERNAAGSGNKYTFREGDRELDAAAVADIKAMIDKMVPDKQAEEADIAGKAPVLTVSFKRNTELYNDMTLSFYPYSDAYDLVSFNGEIRQLISVKAAEAVIRLTERLN